MRRKMNFVPSVDRMESRLSLSDIPLNGVGQDGAVGGMPPPGTTVELAPAPTPTDPNAYLYVSVVQGITTTATLGWYTYPPLTTLTPGTTTTGH